MTAYQGRVYWEDTTGDGFAGHANFLKFFERARTEWLISSAVSQRALVAEQVIFVVRESTVRQWRSVSVEAPIEVTVQAMEVGRTSMVFFQEIKSGPDVVAEAQVVVCCVDAVSFRPSRIPPKIVDLASAIFAPRARYPAVPVGEAVSGWTTWQGTVRRYECDAMGVVYYANYALLMDEARNSCLRSLSEIGLPGSCELSKRGFVLTAKHQSIGFLKSLRAGDDYEIKSRLSDSGSGLVLHQEIHAGGALLSQGVSSLDFICQQPGEGRAIGEFLGGALS